MKKFSKVSYGWSMGAAMLDGIPVQSAGDVPPTSITEQREYCDAFISYSDAADGSLTPALQHGVTGQCHLAIWRSWL